MILLFIYYLDHWTNLKKTSILRGTSEEVPFYFSSKRDNIFGLKNKDFS